MEIKIRKIEKNVADKLTELAKKKGVSRETYIRDYLNTLAVAPELKEMDFKYANLVETLADQARSMQILLIRIIIY